MGASSSNSKSKPVDMTPQAFKNLQQPFANVVGQLLQGASGNVSNIFDNYSGPLTTQIGSNEQSILNQLMGIANSSPSTAAGGQPAGGGTGVQDTSNGPVAAPNTSTAAPNQTPADNQQVKDLLSGMVQSGSSAQGINDYVNSLNIGPQGQSSLSDFMASLGGASGTGAFSGDADNPFLQSYVQAAQRQTQQALEETLGRTLPGRFALAGQRTQPGASSAFDRAAAIAYRGGADALSDIATNINYQALEAARGREADALGAELGRRGQQDLQSQGNRFEAGQNAADRALQAPQIEAALQKSKTDDELTRAQTGQTQANTQLTNQQVTGQQIDNLVQNLNAQALPRLIQEMGIERGMEVYNDRINTLLSGLGVAAGVTRPVIGNSSSSSSFGFNLK